MTTAEMKTKEQTVIALGLVDALVALYPDAPVDGEDDAFFAVLMQTQRVMQELKERVHEEDELTPLSVIG